MREYRCKKCNKLLAKVAYGELEIKCKCGELAKIKVYSQLMVTDAYSKLSIDTSSYPQDNILNNLN